MLNYSIPIQLLIKMFKIENITEMREKFWYVAVIVIFYYKRENPEKDLFIREIVLKTECFHSELSTLSGVDINQALSLNNLKYQGQYADRTFFFNQDWKLSEYFLNGKLFLSWCIIFCFPFSYFLLS